MKDTNKLEVSRTEDMMNVIEDALITSGFSTRLDGYDIYIVDPKTSVEYVIKVRSPYDL